MTTDKVEAQVSVLSLLLTLLFIMLKLTGLIQWSWLWVLCLLWLPLAAVLTVWFVILAIVIVFVVFVLLIMVFISTCVFFRDVVGRS